MNEARNKEGLRETCASMRERATQNPATTLNKDGLRETCVRMRERATQNG